MDGVVDDELLLDELALALPVSLPTTAGAGGSGCSSSHGQMKPPSVPGSNSFILTSLSDSLIA